MHRTGIAAGSFRGKSARKQNQSKVRRAAVEVLESRRYLTYGENPFDLPINVSSASYEGDWAVVTIDWTNSPYGIPNTIHVESADGSATSGFEQGIDFTPDGNLTTLSVNLPDQDSKIRVYNQLEDEDDYWFFTGGVQNVVPSGSMSNNGPMNEGSPVQVWFNASDVSAADNLSLRYSFSTDFNALASDYASAGTDAGGPLTFNDNGTYTVYGRVFDKDGGYLDLSTNVTVVNVAPYATFTISEPAANGSVTVSLTNPSDPSSVDHATGYKYVFSTNYNSLPLHASGAGTTNSRTFTTEEMEGLAQNALWARIFDKNDGYRDYNVSVPPLSVTAANSSQLNLTWTDTATGETNWRVQVSEDGSTFTHLIDLGPNIDHYEVTGLLDGTRRWYRVRAVGTPGTASDTIYSPKKAATTHLRPPTRVVAVAEPGEETGIVTWQDNSQAEAHYSILQSTDGVTFQEIGTAPANSTSFNLNNLSESTQYLYVVGARLTGVAPGDSALTGLSTLGVNDLKFLPSQSSFNYSGVQGSRQSLTLKFDQDINGSLQSGDILLENLLYPDQLIAISDSDWTYNPSNFTLTITFNNQVNNPSAPDTSHLVTGILPDGIYQLRILAGTLNTTQDRPLVADADFEFFFLIGDANRDRTVNLYDMVIHATNWQGSDKTFSEGDFDYDGVVDSADLAILGFKWQTTLPALSTFNVIAQGPNSIHLNWDPPGHTAQGWRVQRSADGQTFTTLGSDRPGDQRWFDDNTVQDGKRYWYRIYELDQNGTAFSTPYTLKKGATTALVMPTNVVAEPRISDFGQIWIHWNYTGQNATHFLVERQSDSGAWSVVDTKAAHPGNPSYNAVDAFFWGSPGFTYRVTAVNSTGSTASAVSSRVDVGTDVFAIRDPGDFVTVSWEDTSANETGFQVQHRIVGGEWETSTALFPPTGPNITSQTSAFFLTPLFNWEFRVKPLGTTDPAYGAAPLPVGTPAAPEGLWFTNLTTSKVGFTWSSVANATGYIVYRKAPTGKWAEVGRTAAGQTSFADGSVVPESDYIYGVVAILSGGPSARGITKTVAPQDGSADPDEDGLNNLGELNYGTDPDYFDSDSDLLPDGWEVENGLDALNSDEDGDNTIDGDDHFDSDTLTNLQESNWGTDPGSSDTDGDGVDDDDEANAGSDPTDASDQGIPQANDMKARFNIEVGDHSGSHSERWALQVGKIIHTAPGFGLVGDDDYFFDAGKSYPIKLLHMGSNLATPDYDWTAGVGPTAGAPTLPYFIIDDAPQILGVYDPSDTNPVAGKTSYLHIPLLDADVDSNNDGGFTPPTDNKEEDRLEQDATKSKIIWSNNHDFDRDGVIDTSDLNIEEWNFVPMVLRLSQNVQETQPTAPNEIKLTYDSTYLRIWKKDASDPTRSLSDVIPSGTFISAADLGLTPGGSKTVFIEALQAQTASSALTVTATVKVTGSKWTGNLDDVVRVVTLDSRIVQADETGYDTQPATGEFASIISLPDVQITSISILNVQASYDGTQILGDISIEGTVDSAIADIVAGSLGTIDTVDVYINGDLLPVGSLSVSGTKRQDLTSFTKPYDFTSIANPNAPATFLGSFPDVVLHPDTNIITVTASGKVYGETGFASTLVNITATPPVNPPPTDPAGNRDYSGDTFTVGQAQAGPHSVSGDLSRYAIEVLGPAAVLDDLGHVETTGGWYNLVQYQGNSKYYLSIINQQVGEAVAWKNNLPPAHIQGGFRLKSGHPNIQDLGNGASRITYEIERHVIFDPTGNNFASFWESTGVNELIVSSETAGSWQQFIRVLFEQIEDEQVLQDKMRTIALLEGTLRMVPFGSLAIDVNDGTVSSDTFKQATIDGVLTFTPMMLARPLRAGAVVAGGAVATERAIPVVHRSLLRGGTADVATDFGAKAASTLDGGFTNLGNPRIPTLLDAPLISNGIRTVDDAVSVNIGQFDGYWRRLTPVDLTPPPQSVLQNFTANDALAQVIDPISNQSFVEFWRVAGGQAGDTGAWMSRIRPASASQAREIFALPPGSTGNRLIKVRVPVGEVFYEGKAIGQFGHTGGGNQIWIAPERLNSEWFEFIELLPE